jgi:hypothetical protein
MEPRLRPGFFFASGRRLEKRRQTRREDRMKGCTAPAGALSGDKSGSARSRGVVGRVAESERVVP